MRDNESNRWRGREGRREGQKDCEVERESEGVKQAVVFPHLANRMLRGLFFLLLFIHLIFVKKICVL